MFTTCLLIVKYLYDDFLVMYFYSRVLKRKYPWNITVIATIIWWLTQCLTKITVFATSGIIMPELLTFLSIFGYGLYVAVIYDASKGKKALALFLIIFILGVIELISYIPTKLLIGTFALMQMDNPFTAVSILVQVPIEPLGIYLLIRLWKAMLNIRWKLKWQFWFCVILPFSQLLFLMHTAMNYTVHDIQTPALTLLGFLLGFAADFSMLVLFFRAGQREKAEEELQVLQHQYELERLRYEHLLEQQKETAKLRHDFQNYILTMRTME